MKILLHPVHYVNILARFDNLPISIIDPNVRNLLRGVEVTIGEECEQ